MLFLVGCDCCDISSEDCNHGVEFECTCECEPPYGGVSCELKLASYFSGTYRGTTKVNAVTNFDSLRIDTFATNANIAINHNFYGEFVYKNNVTGISFVIPTQNTLIDSTIQVEGDGYFKQDSLFLTLKKIENGEEKTYFYQTKR